ncbi:hypothetical protein WG66_014214 [Moniliophthora roreri]|nr:hypothetical protein WG66_014214 [Moniliophthora roreri]
MTGLSSPCCCVEVESNLNDSFEAFVCTGWTSSLLTQMTRGGAPYDESPFDILHGFATRCSGSWISEHDFVYVFEDSGHLLKRDVGPHHALYPWILRANSKVEGSVRRSVVLSREQYDGSWLCLGAARDNPKHQYYQRQT